MQTEIMKEFMFYQVGVMLYRSFNKKKTKKKQKKKKKNTLIFFLPPISAFNILMAAAEFTK